MNGREITIASVIAGAAFFASLLYAYVSFQSSLDAERLKNQQTVNAIFQQRMDQFETTAYDYTYWDETLNKGVIEQDEVWANKNIGRYLLDTFQIQNTYLFDHKGHIIFSFGEDKEKIRQSLYSMMAFKDAVQKTTATNRNEAKAYGLYLKVGERFYQVAVSAVTKEGEFGPRTTAELAYLAIVKSIEQWQLDKIATDFQISGLSFLPDNQTTRLNIYGKTEGFVFPLFYRSDKNFVTENGWNLIPLLITLLSLLYLIALVQKKVTQAENLNRELATFNERLAIQVKEKTEQLLLKTQKAEEASEAKSVFLSAMSHEFRTPLNGILGFTQMLRMNSCHTLTEKQIDWVNQIFSAGSLLLEIVNDVLDLARIESGRIEYVPETFQPREVFRECYDIIKPMADDKGISLRGLPETDRFVHVDRAKLKQAVLNLTSNAVKYGRKGGHVTFGCRSLGEDQIELYVQDDGIGIPESELNLIFDPFHRVPQQSIRIDGTGIGLSIVKKNIELMDGKISVSSELGTGSCFTVTLPARNLSSEQKVVHFDI